MSLLNQKTIRKKVSFSGVGLHSGIIVKICIKPSEPDTGIVFKRTDLKTNNLIYPNFMNVSNTALCTTISNSHGVKVSTIEHLMGALFGLGVDNALVEIDNEEVPILDGSAKLFINEILSVGLESSNKPIKIIKINRKVEFKNGDKFISIEPSKLSLDIDFQLKYQNQTIGNQRNKVNVYEDNLEEIFNSRTFCLYEDIEAIKKNGLAKGGSLENAIVVKGENILNPDGLRNTKEFVNHKILDCIGDLFTSGYRMIASINCSQGGHFMTNSLLKKVFENKENFSIIEIQERTLPHTLINRSLLRSIA
ncbi:UDP-3-O-acyl-N-acetylglucosamine deacetylase [Candidatus Pelagibacter sp.]|uniref:UDP-3-O-acyl-N-acetylglucosamine deacetylase n=1 Tax=Candidatus Pelagibacter sp. TaxID=2024849 RepID=UPI003F871D78